MFDIKSKRALKLSSTITPAVTRCAHCVRIMNNFAGGSSRGFNGEPLCHPNGPNRPNCYKLVTVYGHDTPCLNEKCYQDLPNLQDYLITSKKKRRARATHAQRRN